MKGFRLLYRALLSLLPQEFLERHGAQALRMATMRVREESGLRRVVRAARELLDLSLAVPVSGSGNGHVRESHERDAATRAGPPRRPRASGWRPGTGCAPPADGDPRSAERGPTLLACLLWVFALFAAVLALVGIYGVIAYTVRQREREIALRIAVGADRGVITRLFLRQGGAVWLLAWHWASAARCCSASSWSRNYSACVPLSQW